MPARILDHGGNAARVGGSRIVAVDGTELVAVRGVLRRVFTLRRKFQKYDLDTTREPGARVVERLVASSDNGEILVAAADSDQFHLQIDRWRRDLDARAKEPGKVGMRGSVAAGASPIKSLPSGPTAGESMSPTTGVQGAATRELARVASDRHRIRGPRGSQDGGGGTAPSEPVYVCPSLAKHPWHRVGHGRSVR